jgi:predicted transcriptional regulator
MSKRMLSTDSSISRVTHSTEDENERLKYRVLKNESKLETIQQELTKVKEAVERLMDRFNSSITDQGSTERHTKKFYIPVRTLRNLRDDLNSKIDSVMQKSQNRSPCLLSLR